MLLVKALDFVEYPPSLVVHFQTPGLVGIEPIDQPRSKGVELPELLAGNRRFDLRRESIIAFLQSLVEISPQPSQLR